MANFEAFRWVISSSINVLFLKSDKMIGANFPDEGHDGIVVIADAGHRF